MKNGKYKKILASSLAITMLMSGFSTLPVSADAVPVVTIGADLSQEQRDKIFSFFGTSENVVEVIEVNNSQERKYLEGLVPNDIIGTRTLSCSYIMPQTSGGLVVKTANLNWVSDGMLANALLTSGVENCQVLATAPFEVSGTGALTGVLLAYEKSSGETLDDEKKELATEELVVSGDLISEIEENSETLEEVETNGIDTSKYVLDMLNEMKTEALNGNLDEEGAEAIVNKYAEQYKLDLSEEMKSRLIAYVKDFSAVKYADSFKKSLNSLSERIANGFDININLNLGLDGLIPKGTMNVFEQILTNIKNLFKYMFSGLSDAKNSVSDGVSNIFDNINTDIISYDEPINDESGEGLSESSGVSGDEITEGIDTLTEDNTEEENENE